MRAPSQPLMRSPLSRFQTPTAPRRVSRFFRVWLLLRLPCRADHSAYFGLTSFISSILSAVDVEQTKQLSQRCQCNFRCQREISVHGIVEKAELLLVLAPFSLPGRILWTFGFGMLADRYHYWPITFPGVRRFHIQIPDTYGHRCQPVRQLSFPAD